MIQNHPLKHLETILIIGIGGFAGSNLRYFVDLIVPSTLAATLTVNTLGCLALGFLLYEEIYSGTISRSGRSILATGFIASFTTYTPSGTRADGTEILSDVESGGRPAGAAVSSRRARIATAIRCLHAPS